MVGVQSEGKAQPEARPLEVLSPECLFCLFLNQSESGKGTILDFLLRSGR